jgi:HK97 family phage prohead protease
MADPFISGYAIQWNQPAIIASAFEERFAKGSFDKSLREYPDVNALWSHDSSRPLGRVGNGSLTIKPDAIGLWYSLTPNPESPMGQEALATVGREDVGQVSVSFSPWVEQWDDTGDLPRRLITEARLYEISLVLNGAYGDATSASLTRAEHNATAATERIRRRAEAAQRLRGLIR